MRCRSRVVQSLLVGGVCPPLPARLGACYATAVSRDRNNNNFRKLPGEWLEGGAHCRLELVLSVPRWVPHCLG